MRLVALSVLIFAMTSAVQAKDVVTMSQFTPFAEDSQATDAVKEECGLEEHLPKYLKSYAKKHTEVVFTTELLENIEGKTLYLEFEQVFAPGGGGYSGGKSVSVVGELRENGEVIGSLTADESAIFSLTPGTCKLLKKVAKKLGEEIGEWLEAPEMDSMLGNAATD